MNDQLRVLVANRGEIALRVIRTASELGHTTIAIYADQDIDAPFARAAHEAYALGGTTAAQTYLNAARVLELVAQTGADAVHPGYGFLSEDPAFAGAVTDLGVAWLGPSAEVISLLGDKIQARRTALAAGVQPVPGTLEAFTSQAQVEEFVGDHGYPVVLKAADGGGGRGIHVIHQTSDLEEFFTDRDLGGAGFFVEKFIQRARHLETQCGRDSHGNFAVYSTRDCSVQRRHQKLVEEAPAPFVPAEVLDLLHNWSRALFEKVDYQGLGTCEFLLDAEGNLYFLEVNPRLQVEHTVTEEVCGVDLVAAQLAIASGRELPPNNPPRGHSIQIRVTSEDPLSGLLPTTGTATKINWPTGPGIRVDAGIEQGDAVTPDFDSMIAKLIVTAPSRDQAINRALRALKDTEIAGLKTSLPLYQQILTSPQFRGNGNDLGVWTRWLEDGALEQFTQELAETTSDDNEPAPTGPSPTPPPRRTLTIEIDGRRHALTLPAELLTAPNPTNTPPRPAQPLRSTREQNRRQSATPNGDVVLAPSQAIVVRINAKPGQQVEEGEVLLVLESMKMESYIRSPRAGTIATINAQVAANVAAGEVLVTLEEEGAAK